MCIGRRKNDVVCLWVVGRLDGKGEDRFRYVGFLSIWIFEFCEYFLVVD